MPDAPQLRASDEENLVAAGSGSPPLSAERLAGLLEGDQRPARIELRRQIGRLETQLADLFASAFPRGGIEWTVAPAGGPRILGVAELEQVRDALLARVADVRGVLSDRAYVEERKRELLERVIAEPERYHWVRISNEDIGEPGCRHWHSRPRLGLIGMLMGWWRVKLSSGCPLPLGRGPLTKRQKRRRRRGTRPPQQQLRAPQAKPAPTEPVRRRAARDERPPAPWGSFPLMELTVLVALVMLVVGLFLQGAQGTTMIGVGLALGSLAGLELSVREHFAGYRSHTLLLAGTAGVGTVGVCFFIAGFVLAISLAAGAVVLTATAIALRGAFRRASGGLSFRVGGLRG